MRASPPSTLDELLAPGSARSFLDEHLEQRPLFSPGDPQRFAELFCLDDVDELLARGFLSSEERFGVFRSGQRIPLPFLRSTPGFGPRQREDALAQWVRDRHREGDTLVVYGIDRQFQPLRSLAHALGRSLGARVDIGLYLTPEGSQGLAPHWDYMDVFVLQIAGRKRWRLFGEGHALPTKPRRHHWTQPTPPAEPTDELLLSPGDLLYLPRGYTHEPIAEQGQSLHLTIGIHRPQWHELLADSLYSLAQSEVSLRRSVPTTAADLESQARALLQRCAEQVNGDALRRRLRRTLLPETPLPDRQIDQRLARFDAVTDTLRVTRRAGVECLVELHGDEVSLLWPGSEPGHTIRGPRPIAPALEFVAESEGSFAVHELPDGLTAESKRVLVRRLIRAGVLAPVDAPASLRGVA